MTRCGVSVGSLGAQLSSDPDVYISRNGGITWSQVRRGQGGVHMGYSLSVSRHCGVMLRMCVNAVYQLDILWF